MKKNIITNVEINDDFFQEKWNLVNNKIIDKIAQRKKENHDFNENIYIDLVDKVRIKKNELQDLKNLMDLKIVKVEKTYKKKLVNLEYKKSNYILTQFEYQNQKKLLDQKYLSKINLLKKKYEIKYKYQEKLFNQYQNKIKKESILLKKENASQEIVFNKAIDKKIILVKNKHKNDLNINKNALKNANKNLHCNIDNLNKEFLAIDNGLKKQVNQKQIGHDIYEKKINKYKINFLKKYNINSKKCELLNTPVSFKIDKLKANTKVFDSQNFKKFDRKMFNVLNANKLIIAIIIFSLIVGFINPSFFQPANWLNNIMGNNVYFGLLAIGMTFVILVGGIDLSVGSGLAFSGSIMIILFQSGMSIYLAVIIGLIASIGVSLLMGLIISYGKFQAFIVTLVGLLVLGGINRVMLEGKPVSINNDFISFLGSSIDGVLPISLIIFAIVLLIVYIILKWTKYGRKIYAVGSNSDAARVSGINVKRIITSTFLISGLTVGLAALVFISQIKSVSPTTGAGFELDAIAAVVLGGASLTGGKGSVIKTAIGWLVISMLGNIFVFLGLDSNIQLIAKGAIILVAIVLDKDLSFTKKLNSFFKNVKHQIQLL